jgi:hypothetical protein
MTDEPRGEVPVNIPKPQEYEPLWSRTYRQRMDRR